MSVNRSFLNLYIFKKLSISEKRNARIFLLALSKKITTFSRKTKKMGSTALKAVFGYSVS